MDRKNCSKGVCFLFGGLVLAAAYLNVSGCNERRLVEKSNAVENNKIAAPYFSAQTATGKTYNFMQLVEKRPLFLYMIQASCGMNAQAVKYYERIFKAYNGKPNFIGIFDGNAKTYQAWQKIYKVSFPILLDPEMKIIDAYHAERSPWLFMIGTDGKILEEWKGYSKSYLEQLNKLMAENSQLKLKKVDFEGAPSEPRHGCPF